MTLLDTINQPQDLRKLSLPQLDSLAAEIRDLLIQTVAKTGGHLAPNLGVVELTLALHRSFDSPRDKIVWDVGHQAYVHKIICGRRARFETLRTLGGISGFPKPSESEHDAFGVGHSSTSISAALGLALARDLSGGDNEVVAVIGDGSLTGGQAYEALNHAGHLGTRMTVVVNDNEMSIAKNVGAMSEYLAKIRSDPTYSRVKRDIDNALRRIPAIGDSVAKAVERAKDSLKFMLVPGMLFEELGFTYIGPIDGHNVASLCEVLQAAKAMSGPVLIHVITQKGRGYSPAECNADRFHGVGPFCVESGKALNCGGRPSYTAVFGEELVKLAAENPDIVAITAAMPEGTGLKQFGERYPQRFFDVGIAEQHALTLAAGLATAGKRPVVAVYSTFSQRAFDQIVHDICLQNLPVVICLDRAGIVGEDGATHQGLFDYAFLRLAPNLTMMAPKDEAELRQMLALAFRHNGPCVIRYPRGCRLGVPFDAACPPPVPGKAERIRDGADLTLLAIGSAVEECVIASDLLAKDGIRAGVVNARFVKPLDEAMLRSLSRENAVLVTVEDGCLAGGFGSAVAELISDKQWRWVKLLRLGFPDTFVEHGSRTQLMRQYGLDGAGIAAKAAAFLREHGVK
ncbi:MAG: 1-deoxy-D-xylulose-5-phosphate synthase [Sporomusaceae bacterium]|nr:1-deoxy-D-xylulose-5-phosphate synthase [Sporomusaceae bacterium]